MPVALPFAIAGWIRDVLLAGGYATLAGLTLLENLFPPIPSELVLPLAGFMVGRGELTFLGALIAATAGSVAGALMLYAAGRYGGRWGLERWGRRHLEVGEAWFARHGGKVVFFGRVVPGVRSLVSVPAGAARMPVGVFLVLTTLGSAVWNAALIAAGWALGSNWDRVGEVVGPAGRIVLLVAVLGGGTAAFVLWRRHRRAASAPDGPATF